MLDALWLNISKTWHVKAGYAFGNLKRIATWTLNVSLGFVVVMKYRGVSMFYLYDCQNRIVGNPKGYRTIIGAEREARKKGSKAYQQIWSAFYAHEHPTDRKRIWCVNDKGGWPHDA